MPSIGVVIGHRRWLSLVVVIVVFAACLSSLIAMVGYYPRMSLLVVDAGFHCWLSSKESKSPLQWAHWSSSHQRTSWPWCQTLSNATVRRRRWSQQCVAYDVRKLGMGAERATGLVKFYACSTSSLIRSRTTAYCGSFTDGGASTERQTE